MGGPISKIVNFPKSKPGFDPDTYEQVNKFYIRDDVSAALSGKRYINRVATGSGIP